MFFLILFYFLFFFYFILVLFWVDTHDNIIKLPFSFFIKTFSMDVGWPFNLLNGDYLFKDNIPYNYLLINYFYKLPEFILFLYLVAIPIFFFNRNFFKKKF